MIDGTLTFVRRGPVQPAARDVNQDCTDEACPRHGPPAAPPPPVGAAPTGLEMTANDAMCEARRLAGDPFNRLRRAFGEAWADHRRDKCGTDFEDALHDTFTVIYNLAAGARVNAELLERAESLVSRCASPGFTGYISTMEANAWLADYRARTSPGGGR